MFILDHRALQKHQQNISSVQELGAPGSLCFITLQGVQDFFSPKFVWQFGLLIFDFSKRLDGCAYGPMAIWPNMAHGKSEFVDQKKNFLLVLRVALHLLCQRSNFNTIVHILNLNHISQDFSVQSRNVCQTAIQDMRVGQRGTRGRCHR